MVSVIGYFCQLVYLNSCTPRYENSLRYRPLNYRPITV